MKRIAGALIIAGTFTTMAIAQTPTPTPALAPEAKTLHDMANRLGMLRGPQLRDAILTFEYQATGELLGPAMRGKGMKLTRYKASVAYDAPGMRVDFDRIAPDGSSSERNRLNDLDMPLSLPHQASKRPSPQIHHDAQRKESKHKHRGDEHEENTQ